MKKTPRTFVRLEQFFERQRRRILADLYPQRTRALEHRPDDYEDGDVLMTPLSDMPNEATDVLTIRR